MIHKCKAAWDSHHANQFKRDSMIKETNINERDAIPSDDVQVEDEEFITQIVQYCVQLFKWGRKYKMR